MTKDYRPYKNAMWRARHMKLTLAMYIVFMVVWFSFIGVCLFGLIQFIKWAWNA